jgi:phage terminase large subunit-like protein
VAVTKKRPRGRPTKAIKAEDDAVNIFEMFEKLGDGITEQALSPNMLAYEPHEKQLIFHKSEVTAKLFLGGNRSGKTVAGVIETLWWVTKRHPFRKLPEGKLRIRVVASDFESGVKQILLPLYKQWVIPSDLINGIWEDSWHERSRTLHFANGGFIEFKSSDQDLVKHAGTSRHLVLFDEEPSKAIFDENLLRLVDTNGSWIITETPTEGMTWIYFDLFEKKPQGLLILEVDMDDNPHLSEEAKEKILAFLDEDDRKTRKSGKFTSRGGLIFKNFIDRYPYVIDAWMPPAGWAIYVSIDHGINNPTAMCWHAVSPLADRIITFNVYYRSNKIIADHAAYYHEYNARNHLSPIFVTGDPAMKQRNGVTGTSIVQEYGKHNIYLALEGVPRDVKIGLDKMIAYLRIRTSTQTPTWQVTASCRSLVREMMLYSWKVAISNKVRDRTDPSPEPMKKNDHAIDACRYFFTMMPDLLPEPGDTTPRLSFDPGTIYDTIARMAERPVPGKDNWFHTPPTEAQVHAANRNISPEDWTITSSQMAMSGFDNLEGD